MQIVLQCGSAAMQTIQIRLRAMPSSTLVMHDMPRPKGSESHPPIISIFQCKKGLPPRTWKPHIAQSYAPRTPMHEFMMIRGPMVVADPTPPPAQKIIESGRATWCSEGDSQVSAFQSSCRKEGALEAQSELRRTSLQQWKVRSARPLVRLLRLC